MVVNKPLRGEAKRFISQEGLVINGEEHAYPGSVFPDADILEMRIEKKEFVRVSVVRPDN